MSNWGAASSHSSFMSSGLIYKHLIPLNLYSLNRYQVNIMLPTLMPTGPVVRTLQLQAISVILPQVEIPTAAIGYMGRPVNIPTVKRNGPLLMNVYDIIKEQDGYRNLPRNTIQTWMTLIDTQAIFDRAPDDDFLGNVDIEYIGGKLHLFKAWPSFLGPLQLANPETGFASYDLQITYDYYTWD